MTNIFNKISIKLQLWWSKKVLGWNLNTLDTLQKELIEKSTNITDDREWYVHVDNELSMTCGNLDIQTIYHFNQFLNLLDIDFKLK